MKILESNLCLNTHYIPKRFYVPINIIDINKGKFSDELKVSTIIFLNEKTFLI